MDYRSWAPRYEEIADAFGFRMAREEAAARRLDELLPIAARRSPLPRIAARLHGRTAVVAGRAPGVGAPPIWRLAERPVVLAADGATVGCLEGGLVPELVVTDLDGPVPAELTAAARGALVVLHAHGDNVERLERWVPEFEGELAGSWAGPPTESLLNVGGFTDGDRAAFLAEACGARRVLLWGFDFDRAEPSGSPAAARKLAKLAWARRLLGELASTSAVPIELWAPDGTIRRYSVPPTGPSTQ